MPAKALPALRREGPVWLLPGTATGITTTGSFNFGAGTLGATAPGAALGSAFNR